MGKKEPFQKMVIQPTVAQNGEEESQAPRQKHAVI